MYFTSINIFYTIAALDLKKQLEDNKTINQTIEKYGTDYEALEDVFTKVLAHSAISYVYDIMR